MKHFHPCFVHGLCIHLNIRNQTDSILRSPEKIIFTKFIFFSPGEIILEKIFGFSILFVFRVWFVYLGYIWKKVKWSKMSFAVDLYMVRVSDPKIQNQPPVSYVLLRKLFSRSSYFFLLEKLFLEKIFSFQFGSCFLHRSKIWRRRRPPKNLSRGSHQPCFGLSLCVLATPLKTLKIFYKFYIYLI